MAQVDALDIEVNGVKLAGELIAFEHGSLKTESVTTAGHVNALIADFKKLEEKSNTELELTRFESKSSYGQ
eukprot:8982661-Pyramimonas_sp.AAC.4